MADFVTEAPGSGRPSAVRRNGGLPVLDFAGRLLLAAIFVSSGAQKLIGWPGVVGAIAGKGLPLPELLGALTIAVELGGALAVITGWGLRWGALALAGFTALAAIFFHDFWSFDAAQYTNQFNHFMKNVSIIGGLLVLAARPGRDRLGT